MASRARRQSQYEEAARLAALTSISSEPASCMQHSETTSTENAEEPKVHSHSHASERRRFGYRRLHILLAREGVWLNHKRLFRINCEERLGVRKRDGRKRALGTRAPVALPDGPNRRWSLDFVSDALASARRFRVLAVVDDFTRECLGLVVDTSLSGLRVGRELDRIASLRGYPAMIVCDNGTELTSLSNGTQPGLSIGAQSGLRLNFAEVRVPPHLVSKGIGDMAKGFSATASMPPGFVLESVDETGAVTVITVRSSAAGVDCPGCGGSSHRAHSRYTRTLADLPLSGRAVQLKLLVRRFRCDRELCARRIFSERLACAAP